MSLARVQDGSCGSVGVLREGRRVGCEGSLCVIRRVKTRFVAVSAAAHGIHIENYLVTHR